MNKTWTGTYQLPGQHYKISQKMKRLTGPVWHNHLTFLKEITQKHGIDTSKLDMKSQTTPTLCRSKTKLRGREISMPYLPKLKKQ